jgi:hypothetical protein
MRASESTGRALLELETVVHGQLAAHEPTDALILVALTASGNRARTAHRTADVARAAATIGLGVADWSPMSEPGPGEPADPGRPARHAAGPRSARGRSPGRAVSRRGRIADGYARAGTRARHQPRSHPSRAGPPTARPLRQPRVQMTGSAPAPPGAQVLIHSRQEIVDRSPCRIAASTSFTG